MGATESKPPPGPNPIRQDSEKIEIIAKALDVKAERQRQLEIKNGWDRFEQDKVGPSL